VSALKKRQWFRPVIGNNRFQRGGKTTCLFDFRFQKRWIVADRMRDRRLEVGLRPDADFAATARAGQQHRAM
jgi:hypothetical protein